MPSKKRIKTAYPGVFYIESLSVANGRPERVYYIRYRKSGKMIEEKAGRQFQNDMTPARANYIRTQRIEGDQLSNRKQRDVLKAKKLAEANRWTIDRLWQEYKINKPELKGLVTDENRFKNYIQPNFGGKEPRKLIPLDTDRLRLKLLKTKSPATVKNTLELLRRIVNFGIKKNLCQAIGFTIEMPRVNNQTTEDLTPEQLSNLLKAIDKDSSRHAANMMKLALFTGMRRGEMFKLKWRDIDFKRGFINIRDPKGGPDQIIPLNNETKKILENHIKTDSDYVFPGRRGQQRTDISRPVNRIKERAGLPKEFRPLHGLRHVYASMLASSGKVDMYTLQKLLTHKSPVMTQRYAHLRDKALRGASDLAGDIINHAIQTENNSVDFDGIKNRKG